MSVYDNIEITVFFFFAMVNISIFNNSDMRYKKWKMLFENINSLIHLN